MPKTTKSYREWQLSKLADPKRAGRYLNSALEESLEAFLVAVGKVAQAHQMSKVAKEAGVQRESLYRSLSDTGNPTIGTLSAVLRAVGLKISIQPDVLGCVTSAVPEPRTGNEYETGGEVFGFSTTSPSFQEPVEKKMFEALVKQYQADQFQPAPSNAGWIPKIPLHWDNTLEKQTTYGN